MERVERNEKLDWFTFKYAGTALWAETDGDESLDSRGIAALADSTVQAMRRDCDSFRALIREAGFDSFLVNRPKRIAHDFWLTRNGHGAGFWDGDYPEPAGSKLTELAHSFGEAYLYVGDDGLIYQMGSES